MLDLEENYGWGDKIRSSIDVAENMYVVLGLIFLKHVPEFLEDISG